MTKFGLFCVFSAALCALGSDPISKDEYRTRRAELRKKLNGTLVMFGWTESRDAVYRTPQDSNFFYLTGWTEPGAIVLLTSNDETIFLPPRNPRLETYNGRRTGPEDPDAGSVTGFQHVLPLSRFESALRAALDAHLDFYASGTAGELARLKAITAFREVTNPGPMIATFRVKKSPAEIAAIQRATDISAAAHRAAWKRLTSGTYEYQAAATFTNVLLEAGCEGHAYDPIFGSGPNATVLHYSANSRRMDTGETVVIDAAAKCSGYASDITRTLPVGGRFTARQRELYEIVLGAEQAVIDAIKPGVMLSELTKIAREYIDKHGKDKEGKSLGKYLPHGVSHPVGLDVHDPAPMNAKIEPGMVLTVEPGIYIKDENIGIRIEDVILVTEKGATVLSAALPRGADEVEKAMGR